MIKRSQVQCLKVPGSVVFVPLILLQLLTCATLNLVTSPKGMLGMQYISIRRPHPHCMYHWKEASEVSN